ncbi:MAG: hypothetical protein MMC33_006942 [Icmadophila ericetorum]|nr:hypothetical protein [Icmadophila ericetorum]
MHIAEVLSDLTSLRVCDHDAALALVSSYKTSQAIDTADSNSSNSSSSRGKSLRRKSTLEGAESDPDLQRAIDLIDLHYGVKEDHVQGRDTGLQQARADVARVIEHLNKTGGGNAALQKR